MTPEGDSGLQLERTYLSWQRTLALMLVVAVLHMSYPWDFGRGVTWDIRVAPVLAAAAAAAFLAVRLRRRLKRLTAEDAPGSLAGPWEVTLVGVAVSALAAGVVASALLA